MNNELTKDRYVRRFFRIYSWIALIGTAVFVVLSFLTLPLFSPVEGTSLFSLETYGVLTGALDSLILAFPISLALFAIYVFIISYLLEAVQRKFTLLINNWVVGAIYFVLTPLFLLINTPMANFFLERILDFRGFH